MRVEDWFALAVRVAGLALLLIPGVLTLLDSLLLKLGYSTVPDTQPSYFLIYGAVQVVTGFYLIRGAPFLVGLVYSNQEDDEADTEEK